jgi:formylmethanofuran dehydrogenase subunit C
MSVTITPTYDTTLPIDLRGFSPGKFVNQSVSEICQFKIYLGNRRCEFGELFKVSGDTRNAHIIFDCDVTNVHWIGAGMTHGAIEIKGSAGRHLGSGMTGGTIAVSGNVSDKAGCEMTGGLIRVSGNAGDQLGCAYPGNKFGINGGTLLIGGDAGNGIGFRMRRGVIAIGGNAGATIGHNMLAGTILVFGNCGSYPGVGMKRGTLGLLGETSPELPLSFIRGSRMNSVVPRLLQRYLREMASDHVDSLNTAALVDQSLWNYHGDMLSGGRGEIWMPN